MNDHMSSSGLTSRNVGPDRGKKKLYDSPARLLFLIVLTNPPAETAERFFAHGTDSASVVLDIMIDVSLMVIFLSPVLYLLLFKPMLIHIDSHRRAEEALRTSEEKLQYLSSQIMFIQEQDRKQFSMELHDDLGQVLNIIKLQLRSLSQKLQRDQVEARDEIEVAAQFLNGGIESIRRLSRALSPCILEDLGLTAALKGITNEFRNTCDRGGVTEIAPIDHLVSDRDRIFIYRIFQEALANIAKHAMAGTVSVEVKNNDRNVLFSIKDDGQGFDAGEVATKDFAKHGLGLAIMRERARMIGGSLEVCSRKGEGTRISFSVPIHMQKKEAACAPTV
jgi:signal transduction histidine kinase